MCKYLIPACKARIDVTVANSRFIATIGPVFTLSEAKDFIQRIQKEFSDASANVPAYVVGHGATVIAHCSDDGEPTGTAGRPALAVLRGSALGDAAVVITRYFGGTELGTGGLVRAYANAVRKVLAVVPRARRVPSHTVRIVLPYPLFERFKLLVAAHQGTVIDQEFAADVTLTATFPVECFDELQIALQDISRGRVYAEIIDTADRIVPLGDDNTGPEHRSR